MTEGILVDGRANVPRLVVGVSRVGGEKGIGDAVGSMVDGEAVVDRVSEGKLIESTFGDANVTD